MRAVLQNLMLTKVTCYMVIVCGNTCIYCAFVHTPMIIYSGDISRRQIHVPGWTEHSGWKLLLSLEHTTLAGECAQGTTG